MQLEGMTSLEMLSKKWDEPITVGELVAALAAWGVPDDAILTHDDDTRTRSTTRLTLEKGPFGTLEVHTS